LESKHAEINAWEKRIKELEIELGKQKALVKDLKEKMAKKQKSQFQSENDCCNKVTNSRCSMFSNNTRDPHRMRLRRQ
jgi:uncharacterized coiled-coil protein SlyX